MNKLFVIKSTHDDGAEYFCSKSNYSIGYFYPKALDIKILYVDKIDGDTYITRRPVFTMFTPVLTCSQ